MRKKCSKPRRLRKVLNEVLRSDCFSDGLYFFTHLGFHGFSPYFTLGPLSLEKQLKSVHVMRQVYLFIFWPFQMHFCYLVSNMPSKKIFEREWAFLTLGRGKKKKENFRYLENGKEHEEIKQHRFPWQKRNSLPAITSIAQMGRGGGEWRTASYRTFLPLLCGFLLINGALPAATNILHLYSLPDSKPSTFF